MEKILTFCLICLLTLLFLYPPCIMAAQSNSQVRVSVASIDDLHVSSATQGILLQIDSTPGSDALVGAPDTTARLSYSHNAPGRKRITAQVNPGDLPAGSHDITLKVAVSGGSEQTVVAGGMAQGAKNVLTGIASGDRENVPVTYSAAATASGTRPGDYSFTVTFTSLDDE